MGKVHVRATQMGYYEHKRIREGQLFHIEESFLKYGDGGKLLAPKWVELVSQKSSGEPVQSKRKAVADKSDDVI